MTPHLAEQPQQQAQEVADAVETAAQAWVDRAVAVHAGERPCDISDYRDAFLFALDQLTAALAPAPQDAGEVRPDDGPELWCRQHIGWLKSYAAGMSPDNWCDMQLRIQRQIDELSVDITAALQSRDQAARAGERERCAKVADEARDNALLNAHTTTIAASRRHWQAQYTGAAAIAAAIRATAGDGR
jgi:hypothetical protein